jgi:fatty acid hydroxylase domain-containing protein 2
MTIYLLLFAVHILTYWIFSLLFSCADLYWIHTGKYNDYKISPEKRRIPSLGKIAEAVCVTIVNQVISYPVISYLVPGCIDGNMTIGWQYLVIFVFYTVIADQWFYWTHRMMHIRFLYRHIHTIHHRWTYPIAVRAIYAHPVEHIISNIGSLVIGPLLWPASVELMVLWTIVATFNAVSAHSGVSISAVGAEKHDLHHRYLNCNYGTTGFSDRMYGTRRFDPEPGSGPGPGH